MSAKMPRHPYREVAIVAVHNTKQARVLEGESATSLQLSASLAVLDEAGFDRTAIDGIVSDLAGDLVYHLGLQPTWTCGGINIGIRAVQAAANAIAAGIAETVLLVDGHAGLYTERASTAPWTRPENEFVASFGMFTAVQFAFIAQRHMNQYGTTPEQLAMVSSIVRNNGSVNPEAVCYNLGPYSPKDVLESRMIADPFHLLDCSLTSEGGIAVLMTTADRAKDLPNKPAYILGAGFDVIGPGYHVPPSWDLHAFDSDELPLGFIGRRASRQAFATAGLRPEDVDVGELYDAFSFEVIRQLEAFGFCGDGEGGPFVEDGNIGPHGSLPVVTDGGLLSFNHSYTAQTLQRVGRAVLQVQGRCPTMQVANAEVALAANFGAGALSCDVMLIGNSRP